MVKSIPDGYNTVTPTLTVAGAEDAIAYYREAFGADILMVKKGSSPPFKGRVMHAELRIGDSMIFLHERCPEMGIHSPQDLKGSPVTLWLYVEDADETFNRAVKAGGKVTMPLMDAFWGDRFGKLTDPFGHEWAIATHKEDLTPDEMDRREIEHGKKMGEAAGQ